MILAHAAGGMEPADESMNAAIGQARAGGPSDAFVAVGGGSSIDTAKAIDLLLTNPSGSRTGSARSATRPATPRRWSRGR